MDAGEEVPFEAFQRLRICVGTVVEAMPNPRAKVPAYVLRIDFGPFGVRTSSAQITHHYTPQDLVGFQVVGDHEFRSETGSGGEIRSAGAGRPMRTGRRRVAATFLSSCQRRAGRLKGIPPTDFPDLPVRQDPNPPAPAGGLRLCDRTEGDRGPGRTGIDRGLFPRRACSRFR